MVIGSSSYGTSPTSPPTLTSSIAAPPMYGSMASAAGPSSSSSSSSALTHSHDTELALAELELLGQNQKKLGALTNRMTIILSGFDRRLIKLESTMLPIHRSTQTLLRIQNNVDEVLDSLGKTLGHYDVVQDEEPLIRQGASVRDPGPYLDTIKRVQQGLDYLSKSDLKSQHKVMLRMNDLIEIGSRNVTSVVKDWISAESSDIIDPSDYIPRGIALPQLSSATTEAVVPLLSFLKTLPTHPKTHHVPFSSSLSAYAELRGQYLEACLAPSSSRIISYAQERVGGSAGAAGRAGMAAAWEDEEEAVYVRGSAGLVDWISTIVEMAENEYHILSSLLQSLDPPSSTTTIQSTFARVLRAPLREFGQTINGLHTDVRRNMGLSTSHTFFAFDIVAGLSEASSRWEAVIVNGCGGHQGGGNGNSEGQANAHALSEGLQSLRGTAMQIFPTFIQSINAMPQQREAEVPSTTINEITYSSLSFMRHLCEYSDVVAPLLSTLGAGNWMMGSGGAPVLSLGLEGEQENILAQYLADVLAAVLNALEARSRAIRQPSTASIFLLNNVGHLRREIGSGAREGNNLAAYLGVTGEELVEGAMRQANTAYLDAWSPVAGALMEDGPGAGMQGKSAGRIAGMGGGGERAAVKDRFAKFYDGLDDLERLHRAYPIAREDSQLREKLRSDVIRLVCPLYARFVAKHRTGDFSKNPQKHIRMTESDVEERLSSLFK